MADTEAARKHPDGPPPAEAEVHQAVERINQSLPASNQGIEFAVDADTDRVIVKVVDRETREVLRQMPSEEALEIAKALENMDPETEAVVNAVVRRQERAMRKQYEEYYQKAEAKMAELLEAQ